MYFDVLMWFSLQTSLLFFMVYRVRCQNHLLLPNYLSVLSCPPAVSPLSTFFFFSSAFNVMRKSYIKCGGRVNRRIYILLLFSKMVVHADVHHTLHLYKMDERTTNAYICINSSLTHASILMVLRSWNQDWRKSGVASEDSINHKYPKIWYHSIKVGNNKFCLD